MTTKDLKAEARGKLALNMHQAISVYAIEFLLFVTLIALVVVSCVCLGTRMKLAAIVMICYGVVLFLAMLIISGIIGFAMTDFYLASYRCIPYNIRRLGDTVVRSGVHKILTLNIIRTLLGFLLLLALIVPGVIYLCRTSMANHLLIANPRMKAKEALKASSKVMSGKSGAYFVLMLSMIGWMALGILTLGLGFVFVLPYVNLVKTEYYKRNLQGDRNTYRLQPQPVAQTPVQGQPVPPQQQVVAAQPMNAPQNAPDAAVQPVSDAAAQNAKEQAAQPVYIEADMQPISSLDDSDIKEMNDTMRDFGGEAVVVEVPEVPIGPVTTTKKETVNQSVSGDRTVSNPVIDSDIVEIVKPLTTREVEDINPYARKIDNMFSGGKAQGDAAVKRDYFGGERNQKADDFVTAEVSVEQQEAIDANTAASGMINADDGADAEQADNDGGENQDEQNDSVMSDAAFAEFLKNFDNIPTPQPEFVPLKQRSAPSSQQPKVEPQKDNGATDGNAEKSAFSRPTRVGAGGAEHAETPAEKLRREREERLNQLRKNRK